MTTDVLVPRPQLRAACDAWRKMLFAWSNLRLDTPEDQQVHDKLVAMTERSVNAVAAVAWPGGFCEDHWSWLCGRGQGKCQDAGS